MTDRDQPVPVGDVEKRSLDLKSMTEARVALGRFGAGQPTKVQLAFLMDHARAREAVWSEVDRHALSLRLNAMGLDAIEVASLAEERETYVRRPDLGRQLSSSSAEQLRSVRPEGGGHFDVVIVVADGLSSNAVEINATPLIEALQTRLKELNLSLAPIVLAENARVALADPVGEALEAKVSIILIGERPGLSAADSLGAYVTYEPRSGTPDSRRNCISNIRDGGMSIASAADAITALVKAMVQTGISGVALREAAALLR
jgi:ethanolamine ammonia-lyase large subunit/ethanolamine ammonia-lyase small subunit